MNSLSATIFPAWQAFQANMPVRIAPARSTAHYEQLVTLMDALIEAIGDDEGHPDIDLLDLVSQLVEDYENEHVVIADISPAEMLHYLMTENGLTQASLKSELGGQSVVSEILSGHRQINTRQAKALAVRFNISPSVFI